MANAQELFASIKFFVSEVQTAFEGLDGEPGEEVLALLEDADEALSDLVDGIKEERG